MRQTRQHYDRVILDLCGGTGSWSKPYREAGYDVRIVTLPEQDVRWFETLEKPVHGILAAPPCTHFSAAGAQYWPEKDKDGRTLEGVSIVDACMRIITVHDPVWWALENPVGRLKRWLGEPDMYFDPCDYGDPWTKQTCLWGDFTEPKQRPVEPKKWSSQGSWTQRLGPNVCSAPGWSSTAKLPDAIQDVLDEHDGDVDRKTIRSITPPGFARAFFEANP